MDKEAEQGNQEMSNKLDDSLLFVICIIEQEINGMKMYSLTFCDSLVVILLQQNNIEFHIRKAHNLWSMSIYSLANFFFIIIFCPIICVNRKCCCVLCLVVSRSTLD